MIRFTIAAILMPSLLATAGERDQPFSATVADVLEGDVLEADASGVSYEVRVFGVDCPDEGQPGFEKAQAFTRALVNGTELIFEPKGTDIHDRLVCEVAWPDGRDLGRELVRAGWAWRYRAHAERDLVLTRLTYHAMESKLGLWADATPLAPWDHRGERPGDEVYFPFTDDAVVASTAVVEKPRTIDLTATQLGAQEKSVTVNPDGSRRLVLKGDHKQTESDVAFIQNSNRIMRNAVAQRAEEKRLGAAAQRRTIQSGIQTNIAVSESRRYSSDYPYVLGGPVIITDGFGFPRAIILPPQHVPAPDDPTDDDLWPYVRRR